VTSVTPPGTEVMTMVTWCAGYDAVCAALVPLSNASKIDAPNILVIGDFLGTFS
jgi:hypothetical protein